MKQNKFDIVNFVGNDQTRPQMNGLHYKNGYVYATDSHVLCKLPTVGQDELDGKTINAFSGKEITVGKYPNCESVIPHYTNSRRVDLDGIQRAINFAKDVESCGTKYHKISMFVRIRVNVGDEEHRIFFRQEYLQVFLDAMAEFQIHDLYYSADDAGRRCIMAKSDLDQTGRQATFVCMPIGAIDGCSYVDVDGGVFLNDLYGMESERANAQYKVDNTEILTKADSAKVKRYQRQVEKIDRILSVVRTETAETVEPEETPETTTTVESEPVQDEETEETTCTVAVEATETASESETQDEVDECSPESQNVATEPENENTSFFWLENKADLMDTMERFQMYRQDGRIADELIDLANVARDEDGLTVAKSLKTMEQTDRTDLEYNLLVPSLKTYLIDKVQDLYGEFIADVLRTAYISDCWQTMDFRRVCGEISWYNKEEETEKPEETQPEPVDEEPDPEIGVNPMDTWSNPAPKRSRDYSGQKEHLMSLEEIETDTTGVYAIYRKEEWMQKSRRDEAGLTGKGVVESIRKVQRAFRQVEETNGVEEAKKYLTGTYEIREKSKGVVFRYRYEPTEKPTVESPVHRIFRKMGKAFSFIF